MAMTQRETFGRQAGFVPETQSAERL